MTSTICESSSSSVSVLKQQSHTVSPSPPRLIAKRTFKILNPNERAAQKEEEAKALLGGAAAVRPAVSSKEAMRKHKSLALQLKRQQALPRFCQQMPLKIVYLDFIVNGSKTIEGRINSGIPARMRVNDYMLFFTNDDCCLVQITGKTSFPTFRKMLDQHGIKACLPDFLGNLDAAERLYRSFPGYAEKEAKFGVLGLEVKLVSNEEMENLLKQASKETRQQDRDISSSKRKRDDDEVDTRDEINRNQKRSHNESS